MNKIFNEIEQAIIENSCYFVLDKDFKIVSTNKLFCNLIKQDNSDILNKNFLTLFKNKIKPDELKNENVIKLVLKDNRGTVYLATICDKIYNIYFSKDKFFSSSTIAFFL